MQHSQTVKGQSHYDDGFSAQNHSHTIILHTLTSPTTALTRNGFITRDSLVAGLSMLYSIQNTDTLCSYRLMISKGLESEYSLKTAYLRDFNET